jgi:hypothetical protein
MKDLAHFWSDVLDRFPFKTSKRIPCMYFKELANLFSGGRDTAGVHGPARGLRLLAPGGTSLQPRGPAQPPHRA